jgi:cation diffusion facilitator family transporter
MHDPQRATGLPQREVSSGQFPEPVGQPAHIPEVRRSRLREMQRVTLLGITVRLIAVAAESVALWLWGYAALLTDVVASLFDVGSSFAILAAIRYAARPPDEEHPFGHGRLEPLAGLQLGVMLAFAGAWLAWKHVVGLAETPAEGVISGWAWLVPTAAAVALELVARIVAGIGRSEQSTALMAEASHYRTDAWTSGIAAAGLAAAAAWPAVGHRLDLLSAVLLALIMIVLGGLAIRENLDQLLDRTPQDEHFAQVRTAALAVAGVLGVEKIRIQQAGPDAHVDIDIEVAPALSVEAAHVITQHVRAAIQAAWPMVREVVVHVEPYYAGDH